MKLCFYVRHSVLKLIYFKDPTLGLYHQRQKSFEMWPKALQTDDGPHKCFIMQTLLIFPLLSHNVLHICEHLDVLHLTVLWQLLMRLLFNTNTEADSQQPPTRVSSACTHTLCSFTNSFTTKYSLNMPQKHGFCSFLLCEVSEERKEMNCRV